MSEDCITDYEAWLRRLAEKGGKGTVGNIDARSLGRAADQLKYLREKCEGYRVALADREISPEMITAFMNAYVWSLAGYWPSRADFVTMSEGTNEFEAVRAGLEAVKDSVTW